MGQRGTSNDIVYTRLGQKQTPGKNPRFHGWRGTVTAGAVMAIVVLVVNIVILIWIGTSITIFDGVATVFEGSCAKTKRTSELAHLRTNILSTLLLGASNNAMQCLSSPTRKEIDKSHTTGHWLEIGVPGLKNLRAISKRRLYLWLCLGVSSIPLHLL